MNASPSLEASSARFMEPMLRRAYRNHRRWDEGLWRVLELGTVERVVDGSVAEPILDLGCGDGHVFELLFGPRRNAVGIDVSEVAIAAAERGSAYQRSLVCDAHKMPFPDGEFRTIFSNSVLEHVD